MDDKNRFGATGNQDGGVDDFFSKLRSSGSLDDMDQDEMDANLAPFDASEPEREPIQPVDNADLVLGGEGDGTDKTTVFRTAEKTGKSTSDKRPASGKGTSGTKKGKKDSKKKTVWRTILHVAVYGICALAIVSCVAILAMAMYLGKVTANDDKELDLNSLKLGLSTRIMVQDNETNEWYEYDRIFGQENRVWITYDKMPAELINVLVASEDQRFWNHKGVDLKRTIAAMANMVLQELGFSGFWGNQQGGSTLTQQLIKNITGDDATENESGVLRKIREIYRAYQLERRFSKEQILEAYLNTFRLGGQVAGIQAAAEYYFGVDTEELTAAQSAAIVCITNAPSALDPFANPDANKDRRENTVLWLAHEQGLLTDTEYHDALAESEDFVFDEPHTRTINSGQVSSYFTDMVIDACIRDLQKYNGMTEAEAEYLFFNGGLTVYTTMDPFIQEVIERVLLDQPENSRDRVYAARVYLETEAQVEEAREKYGDPTLQIGDLHPNQIQAAVCIMNYEGEILGVGGGVGEKPASRSLNRAMSPRSTGSSIKPISVYGPAIEFNRTHFSKLYPDAASDTVNGQPWPRNFDSTYGAPVTVYDAVRVSLNTTAVLVLNSIGYETAFDYLQYNLGITSLVDDHDPVTGAAVYPNDVATAPMSMGSLTNGISVVEMCAAFATFGNDGTYTEPHCYSSITDSHGDVVLDRKETLLRTQAFSPQTATIMNRLLQSVMYGGTGTAALPRGTSLTYAGKSGTTSDNYDMWFMGLNPYYVCASWIGYDIPQRMPNTYPRPPQVAFRLIMGEISANLPAKNFPTAEGLTTLQFCRATGNIASGACPDTAKGYYKDGNQPTEVCNHATAPPQPPEEAA